MFRRQRHASRGWADEIDRLAAQLAAGIEARFARRGVAWQVCRVGARLEFGRSPAPENGSQSLAAIDRS